jgi:hypothetical protein
MDGTSPETQAVMEKLQNANKLMEDLIDLAMGDQQITEEEKSILFMINDYLQEYVKILIASLSDNVISDEEKAKLAEIETNIIRDAKKIAMEDSHLSDDEKVILDSLVTAVKELST